LLLFKFQTEVITSGNTLVWKTFGFPSGACLPHSDFQANEAQSKT
jgi:hypothetical protein